MMRSCFLHLVFIFWHSFLMVVGEEASECDNTQLSCEMLRVEPGVEDSNEQTCISPACLVESDIQNFTLEKGQELKFTCNWTSDQTDSAVFRWNLIASSGWRVLLRVVARRVFKVEAGDISDGDNPVQSNTAETVYQKFDSTLHRFFRNVDHFISRNSTLWIRASINDDRGEEVDTFDVIARAVQVEDTIYTKASSCAERPMGEWQQNGFYATGSSSDGSLAVQCNISMFHQGFLTSFYYMLYDRSPLDHDQDNYESGSIQFESVRSRNLTLNRQGAISLNLTVNISQCDSFWIRFEARGDINLIISNVTVQGLIYDDDQDEEAACQPETSEPDPSFSESSESSSSSSSSSFTYTTVSTSLVTLFSTTSITMTTADDKISSTQANSTLVDSSTPGNEKQVSRGTPSFLIPTVSVVAIFLLVSIAVLFICWKKRYRKRQSGNGDSVLSEDDERHEYCDVVPSGKPSSNETTYDFADPSSAENGSGIKNASKDEGTANAKPNSHAADESESPYAENGVLVKGQGYVMVDMGKKASQHQEKPKTLDNTGNDLDKDDHGIDEVKRSPTKNKVIVNGPEYAVVDMEKKASQRKEKAKISLNRGKDHPKGDHCMDQGEGSTEKPKVFKNGQEYAVVDMEKKALERKGKSKMGRSDEKRLETNDDETYFTLEPDASPEYRDGQTNQMNVKSSSGKDTADIHKTPKGESDYDEPQPFGSSSAEQYDELQFNPSVSDLSKKSDNQAKGESTDDAAEAYQTVSASTSPVSSVRPDSYPPSDYEAMSPPTSPGVMLTGTDGQYPSSDNNTGGSLSAAAVEPAHRPLDTYQLVVQDQTSGNRDSSASHTYEDPAVMAEALERPYDKLQRGSDRNKPLATQKTISAADKEVAATANHEDALNVYDEIATANVTLKEADESSGAYQHLQRPLTKRSKAREPLPAIPGDEGYGRLNLEDNGASSHTNAAAHEERESGDSATKDDGPTYATVENPSEAYRPDDDDPAYDLLDTLK